MGIQEDRYCIEVCKARCCFRPDNGKPCPNLGGDFRCKIYHKWENNTCNYVNEGYDTMPIEEAVKKRLLPEDVLKGCVYAHPELLEVFDGNASNRAS